MLGLNLFSLRGNNLEILRVLLVLINNLKFVIDIIYFPTYCLDERGIIKALMADCSKPGSDWQELTRLTQGQPIVVERVRLVGKDITVQGSFELPQLARLSAEDQVFVVAFLRSHGSIKEMEQVFGVSYPTIKARLNRIGASLEFVEMNPGVPRTEVLERLSRGEISADEAIRELEGKS